MTIEEFENVEITLFGCCSYTDTWHPGIKQWGATDEESRNSGYVSVQDYDELLAAYKALLLQKEAI